MSDFIKDGMELQGFICRNLFYKQLCSGNLLRIFLVPETGVSPMVSLLFLNIFIVYMVNPYKFKLLENKSCLN